MASPVSILVGHLAIGVTKKTASIFIDNSQNVSMNILNFISFILTRRGGPFGVHASSWWSHTNLKIIKSIKPLEHLCLLMQRHPRNPNATKSYNMI